MKKRILLWILALVSLIACLTLAASASEPTAEVAGHNLALKDNVYIVYYVDFGNLPSGAEKASSSGPIRKALIPMEKRKQNCRSTSPMPATRPIISPAYRPR